MRISIVLAGVFIATPAAAHDSTAPLAGEEAVEHAHIVDEIGNLLLPKAEASADNSIDGNDRHIHADGYPVQPPQPGGHSGGRQGARSPSSSS